MSLIDRARGKKTLIIALIAACAAVIVLIAVFMPSVVKKPEVAEEVISKRAKLEPQAPEQAMPPAAPQPGTAARVPATQAPAVTTEAKKPAAKPEPEAAKETAKGATAEKAVKKEAVAEKPKKAVKAEKAAPEADRTMAKEKAASSRLSNAKSRPWALNIASYSDVASAKKLVASLRSAGYNAYTTEGRKSGKTWHRVRVGFYRTREDASKSGRTIEKRFNLPSTWVVKPARNETASHINR